LSDRDKGVVAIDPHLEKIVKLIERLLSNNKRRRRKRRGMSSSTVSTAVEADNNGGGGGGGGVGGGSVGSSRVTAHLVLVEGNDEVPKSIPLKESDVRKKSNNYCRMSNC
jgi:hypothetical protein